jgi:hypothetical protein
MAKTPSKKTRSSQQRREYKAKIKKLQDAGLIGKVDTRKHASPATKRILEKYKGFLAGRESAVNAPDAKTARELRRKFGFKGKGKTVIIPRERGERFRISKKGELTSERPNPIEPKTKIKKTFGEKTTSPPGPGERLYYTLPERRRGGTRLRRVTFASFDEMLYFLNNYDINFEDVEDYIEIEKVTVSSARDRSLRDAVNKDHRRKERKSAKRRGVKKKKRPAKKRRR